MHGHACDHYTLISSCGTRAGERDTSEHRKRCAIGSKLLEMRPVKEAQEEADDKFKILESDWSRGLFTFSFKKLDQSQFDIFKMDQ